MYPFRSEFRAQCMKVVDGDTVDLLVDRGFHDFRIERFRFCRINCWELTSTVPSEQALAIKAKDQVIAWFSPRSLPDLKAWNLRISTKKDPDEYGRWLAEIYFTNVAGIEINANDELLRLGLARLYGKK